jgi:hypothetical protein
LQCLSCHSPDHSIVAKILFQVSNLRPSGQSVMLFWVPWHCGHRGNEAANASAKATAMHGPLVSDRVLGTDVCICFRHAILSSWQSEWDNALGKKAYGETICAGVAVLLQIHPEGRCQPHAPSDLLHTPDTRTLVTSGAGAV